MQEKNQVKNFFDVGLKSVKLMPLAIFVLYAVGFLSWNVYLGRFHNFFEFNLLETRFISAGIAFFVIMVAFFLLLLIYFYCISLLVRVFSKKYSKINVGDVLFIFCIALIVNFFYFPFVIFPLIPAAYGGVRPTAITLLGDNQQIKYLHNFDIKSFNKPYTLRSLPQRTA